MLLFFERYFMTPAELSTKSVMSSEAQVQKILSPYSFKRSSLKFLVGPLVVILICLSLMGAIGWWLGPNLWNDWRTGDNWTVDRLGSITKGSCESKFIFMACDAHLTAIDGRNAEIAYVFIDFHSGDYETDVLQSTENPNILSTDLGIEHLTSRLITFSLLQLVFVVFIGFLVRQMGRAMKNRKTQAIVLRGKPKIRLVRVEPVILKNQKAGKRLSGSSTRQLRKPRHFSLIDKPQTSYEYQQNGYLFQPFLFQPNQPIGLAAVSADNRQAVLIDENLDFLAIPKSELPKILAALHQQAVPQPS